MAVEGFFEPLPEAEGEFPIRRGKFIDVEVYGNLFAATGTFTGVTIESAAITDATISGSTTINNATINNATIDAGTITDATLTNVIIEADLKSFNWNGVSDDLSSGAVAATTGYLLDYSAGAAQFQDIYAEGGEIGALDITDALQIVSPGYIYGGTGATIASLQPHAGGLRVTGDGTAGQTLDVNDMTDGIDIRPISGAIPQAMALTVADISNVNLEITGTGRVRAHVGAVSTPSYSFQGDTDTGLYNLSADALGVATNGVRRFSVSNTAAIAGSGVNGNPALKVDAAGSASTPAYTFVGDTNTGMYRYAADAVAMATNTTRRWRVQTPTSDGNAYLRDAGVVVVETPTLGGTAGNITRAMSWELSPSGNAVNLEVQAVRETTGTSHTGMAVGFRRITDSTSQSNLWFTSNGVIVNSTENVSGYEFAVNGQIAQKATTTTSTANTGRWTNVTGTWYEWQRFTSTRRHKFDIDYDPQWTEDYANVKLPAITRHGRIDADNKDDRFYGWIAEDLHEALPALATLDAEGIPDSPDFNQIVMVLAAKIERLEAALNV